jgi:hypothetical protein
VVLENLAHRAVETSTLPLAPPREYRPWEQVEDPKEKWEKEAVNNYLLRFNTSICMRRDASQQPVQPKAGMMAANGNCALGTFGIYC